MGRLKSYPNRKLKSNSVFITDHDSDGTATRTASEVATDLIDLLSPNVHRNTYRGKSLGATVTDSQKAAIKAGTFEGLFVGDYWTINNVKYVIADMDYFYNCGDTAFTKHHLVIVPDAPLYSGVMNDENVTDGGYVGSKMYTEGLTQAKETITAAFGDLVLAHRDYLVNACTNGKPSGGAWFDSTVELMNEIMAYGSFIYARVNSGDTPTMYTTATHQFALFQLNPAALKRRSWFWLRDVVSGGGFASVAGLGAATSGSASASRGVRPYFVIGVN